MKKLLFGFANCFISFSSHAAIYKATIIIEAGTFQNAIIDFDTLTRTSNIVFKIGSTLLTLKTQ